jgi:hypothetical protein
MLADLRAEWNRLEAHGPAGRARYALSALSDGARSLVREWWAAVPVWTRLALASVLGTMLIDGAAGHWRTLTISQSMGVVVMSYSALVTRPRTLGLLRTVGLAAVISFVVFCLCMLAISTCYEAKDSVATEVLKYSVVGLGLACGIAGNIRIARRLGRLDHSRKARPASRAMVLFHAGMVLCLVMPYMGIVLYQVFASKSPNHDFGFVFQVWIALCTTAGLVWRGPTPAKRRLLRAHA